MTDLGLFFWQIQNDGKVYARYMQGICKIYVGYMLAICLVYVRYMQGIARLGDGEVVVKLKKVDSKGVVRG